MSVADKMLKEIVTLAKKLATQEHENKQLWSSNMQLKQVCDSKAEQLRETEQELQRLRQRHVEVQSEEVAAARAEIETLRGAMAADDKRLRDAEEKVWPGVTLGCDAAEKMADEILHLREQLAAANAAVTLQRAGIELQRRVVDKVRQMLFKPNRDICYGDINGLRAALAALDAEPAPVAEPVPQSELSEQGQDSPAPSWAPLIADLRQRLAAAQAALTRERLDAELRGHELERLRAFVSKVRAAMWPEDLKSALAELDAEGGQWASISEECLPPTEQDGGSESEGEK